MRLVFLDKEYSPEVYQALLAVPHFSKVAVKEIKAEAVVWKCSVKKEFLEISQKFTGKHLCQGLFFTTLNLQLY